MQILLIDDDKNLCKVLRYQLEKHRHTVNTAHTGESGLRLFKKKEFDLVLSDIQLPDISGIDVLQQIRSKNKQVVIILITAYGTVSDALEACQIGADDYITKPFGQEQLLFVIEKAFQLRNLQQENYQLRQELAEKFRFENMIISSDVMENLMQTAARVSQSNSTVLILGESGTGKELLARAIHYHSPRKNKPLITVNCPSIPDHLLESELFGHLKGAFTGAIKDRKGKFELAEGGTIFLDEIAELKADLQAKLLRVLQEKEIERLGDTHPTKVDVRLIAATNKHLKKLIDQGKFREDLYYRLSVVPLTIPPLRERKEEIPYLVEYFVKKIAQDQQIEIEKEVIPLLKEYDWPGNIRELENIIERAIVLSTTNKITTENLPGHLIYQNTDIDGRNQLNLLQDLSLENIEKHAIIRALEKSDGNKSRAARLLKIPRHILLYRLKKYHIR
jgi:two-component system NtrC family response regulator